MTLYKIPVTAEPDQSFDVTIPKGRENAYIAFRLRYNLVGKFWSLSLSDSQSQKMLVSEIPLLTGVYPYNDLLRPYRYLGLGKLYCVPASDVVIGERPDDTNLGTSYVLLWEDYNV